MGALRRRLRGDAGVSLVEVLVVMLLLGIVGTLVTRAVVDSHEVVRLTDDQTQGLSDVRLAAERLGRDVRDARSVLCNPAGTPAALAAADPTCLYHLQLWVDYDSDYVQTPAETVTWRLAPGLKPGQFDLLRVVNGVAQTQARTIVTQVAFSYDLQPTATPPPPGATGTRVVNTNMTYDAVLGSGTTAKTVSFSGRLRNVA